MSGPLTLVTFRNLKQARQGSGLVRAAFDNHELPEKLSLEVPEKYNHPTVMRFLETGFIVTGMLKTLDDIPAILNAANYWDIPDLLRFCREAILASLEGDDDAGSPTTTNATQHQRRQFIELMHGK